MSLKPRIEGLPRAAAALGLGAAALGAGTTPADAHHSFNAFFEMDRMIEVEGRVTDVRWVNPHIKIYVEDASGDTWEVEAGPTNLLARMGVEREAVGVGETIKVRGNPGRGDARSLWVMNILVAGGTEILANPSAVPHWGDVAVGDSTVFFEQGDASPPAPSTQSFFRVWPRLISGMPRPVGEPVLTETGRAAQRAYDRGEVVFEDCAPDGMPRGMVNPYPIELVDNGATILIRVEAYDQVRTVHLEPPAAEAPPSLMGHSVGRFEGNALIVETTAIDFHSYNDLGPAQSDQSRVVERFTLSDDGLEMAYEFTITDPVMLAEPWTYRGSFIYREDAEVRPWNCGR